MLTPKLRNDDDGTARRLMWDPGVLPTTIRLEILLQAKMWEHKPEKTLCHESDLSDR